MVRGIARPIRHPGMGHDSEHRPGGRTLVEEADGRGRAPGKRTLTEELPRRSGDETAGADMKRLEAAVRKKAAALFDWTLLVEERGAKLLERIAEAARGAPVKKAGILALRAPVEAVAGRKDVIYKRVVDIIHRLEELRKTDEDVSELELKALYDELGALEMGSKAEPKIPEMGVAQLDEELARIEKILADLTAD